MAGVPLATAFVRVRPSTDSFRRDVEQGVGKAGVDKSGDRAGRTFGGGFSAGLSSALGSTFTRVVGQARSSASAGGAASGRDFADGFTRDAVGRLRDSRGRFAAVGADLGGALGNGLVRDAAGRLREANGRFAAEGDRAGGGFGNAFSRGAGSGRLGLQLLIAAGAAIGPVIVPAAAAAAVAVAAIGPAALAAVAGLGVVALSAIGVVEAVQAMSAAQDQAKQSGATMAAQQSAVAAAADQVRNAEQSLANTRISVADGARRAAQQVADAQRALTDAERDALAVRRDLSRAQLDARQALEDLDSQVRSNALDQRQANVDIAEAKVALDKVLSDPRATALQRQQAQLTYERSVLQQEDLSRRGRRLQAEQKTANKAGVEGSEQVRAARDRIADADRRVSDAQRGLGEAERDRKEQARQGAQQIAQAVQAIAAAERARQTASVRASTGGTAAMQKLKQAMADLSPAGRTFATFLFGLKDEFLSLRQAAERGLLPGVQAGIQALLPLLPQIQTFIERIGAALGGMARRAGEALASPFWVRFFDWLGSTAGPMLEDFGRIAGSVAEGFASITMAFAPMSTDLTSGLARLAARFAEWARSLSGTQGFKDFIAYVRENGPLLVSLLGDVLVVVLKLAVALAPLGTILLKGLVKVFDWLARQDPGVIVAIAAGVAALAAALIVLAAGPVAAIGAITVAVVASVAAVVYAYEHWEAFRTVVDAVVKAIAVSARWLWNVVLKPTFSALVDYWANVLAPAAVWLWRNVLKPAFEGIAAVVSFAWKNIIQPALAALTWWISNVVAPVVTWLWRHVVVPAFQGIQIAVQVAWAIIKVVFGLIQIAVKVLAAVFRWWYETVLKPIFSGLYSAVIKPAWDRIRPILQLLGSYIKDKVAPAFKTGVAAIGAAWDKIRDLTKAPVRFVVDTIINKAIIDNYNKIAKTFGVSTVERVTLPKGFARGGVLPGYTPGRDVHTFTSATGGTLGLSGGEAIVRPEGTRALGRDWVDGINQASRSGGVAGARRFLGYADGGIFDGAGKLFAAAKRKAGDVISGVKNLITDPGGTLRNLAAKVIGLLPGKDTAFGKLLTAVPTKLVGGMADRVSSFFGGGSASGGPGSGASPFGGSAGMMRALRAVFPGLRLISGFRPDARTLSGSKSYHSADRAVDVPPIRAVAAHIFRSFRNITKELITPYQEFNLHNGRPHTYTGAIWNQHNFAGGNAHDHWAAKLGGFMPRLPFGSYDVGGYLPTGLSLAYNGTGSPEPVGHGAGCIHLHNHGVIGSQRELDEWLVSSTTRLRKERRLP